MINTYEDIKKWAKEAGRDLDMFGFLDNRSISSNSKGTRVSFDWGNLKFIDEDWAKEIDDEYQKKIPENAIIKTIRDWDNHWKSIITFEGITK